MDGLWKLFFATGLPQAYNMIKKRGIGDTDGRKPSGDKSDSGEGDKE